MKKTIIAASLATVFAASAAHAASLPPGAVLSIDTGSNFQMGGGTYGSAVGITGNKGLVVGSVQGDFGTGSHGGAPTVSDRGAVTNPWLFFSNTGYDFLSFTNGSGSFSGGTAGGVDMTAWTVTWNGIPNIPMGGCGNVAGGCTTPSGTVYNDTGIGAFTWDGTNGGAYTITYTAHVPVGDASGFGGVQYDLSLQGTVTFAGSLAPNNAPVAVNDDFLAGTTASNVVLGKATLNDYDNDEGDAINVSSVDLDPSTPGVRDTSITTPLGGTLSVDDNGTLTYTAQGTVTGIDSIPYTVSDFRGPVTASATINITVGNIAPVANDDNAPATYLNTDTQSSLDISILANDTDANGNGTIDPTTVDLDPATAGQQTTITTANGGTASVSASGVVTYTPPSITFTGPDSFTYTVMDNDASPLVSNVATVNVLVGSGDPIGPYLILKSGDIGSNNAVTPADGKGSWFSMETSPGTFTYTPIVGYNGLHLYTVTQPASSNPVTPDIDEAWIFFGNRGVDQTTTPIVNVSNDGNGNVELNFSGWNVSWNGIASIPMDAGATVAGFSNSVAKVSCSTTCAIGDTFTLEYSATVPPGDASGFGGVHYFLHLEGTVSDIPPVVLGCDDAGAASVTSVSAYDANCVGVTSAVVPGTAATAAGNSSGLGLSAAQLGTTKDPLLNTRDGTQCLGGCLDFVVTGVTGDYVDLVVHLDTPIKQGAVYRKFINDKWITFDTSGNDKVGSAAADVSGSCPDARANYPIGLRTDNQCLRLRIYDGGPNDADGIKNGTIVDPSGVLIPGSPNVPASGTSGCSISNTPVKLTDRADWLVVIGFIALIGFSGYRRKGIKSQD